MCHSNGADAVADAAGADSVDDQWTSRGHGSALGGDLDTDLLVGRWRLRLLPHGQHVAGPPADQERDQPVPAAHQPDDQRRLPGLPRRWPADAGFDPPGGNTGTPRDSSQGRRGDALRPKHVRRRGRDDLLGLPRGARRDGDEHPDGQGHPERDLQHVRACRRADERRRWSSRRGRRRSDFVDNAAPITEATAKLCQKCHDNPAGYTAANEVKYWRFDGTEDANEDGTNENPADAARHNYNTGLRQLPRPQGQVRRLRLQRLPRRRLQRQRLDGEQLLAGRGRSLPVPARQAPDSHQPVDAEAELHRRDDHRPAAEDHVRLLPRQPLGQPRRRRP